MTIKSSRPFAIAPLFAAAILAASVVGTADRADAYNCQRLANVRLQQTADGKALNVRGRASVEQCFGVKFVYVIVTGPVPDGTAFAPAVVGLEPQLGDFFYASRQHAETGWMIEWVPGTTLTVVDETFTPLLTGTL